MKNKQRCKWVGEDELMILYHDQEWGVPIYNDKKIFEFLVLESMQAGLSWRTILHKRENFKKAFTGFDYKKVAKFDKKEINKLLQDTGIIRNKLKIEAVINNAKKFIEVQKEFGSFSKYMWQFKKAEIFAQDLKNREFKFLGPTTVYAYMQAVGMINDHTKNCFRHMELKSQ